MALKRSDRLATRRIPTRSGVAREPRSRGYRVALLAALVYLPMLAAAGCGGSSGAPAPSGPPSNLRPGSAFTQAAPPLSPNTVWKTPVNPEMDFATGLAPAAQTTPLFDQYFYIVNGLQSDGSPLPTGPGAPTPSSTPLVLTVNGAAPNGATNPNGGTAVGLAPLNPNSNGSQLWKAVAAPTANNFYLRSAESFAVSQVNIGAFNSLVGYGASVAPLELGSITGWATSIFWNEQTSPTGDISSFEQWNYGTSAGNAAQLTNLSSGAQLFSFSPVSVSVGAQSPAPNNQWYTYPNYYLEQVIDQPNSNPPFPAAADSGQCAAYTYLSNAILCGNGNTPCQVSTQTCNYEGTTYSGIRCLYINTNSSSTLTTCESNTSSIPGEIPHNPGTGTCDGVTTSISDADWTATYMQIHQECQNASNVQLMYSNYTSIIDYIQAQDINATTHLAQDVNVSKEQSLHATPIDFIEGILYTALNAISIPGSGAFANLIATAVTTTLAQGGETAQQLTQRLDTTVGNLAGDLNTVFDILTENEANGETAVLEDWGRLSIVGPLSQIDGYNGLGLPPGETTNIGNAALKGYSLTAMQALAPLAYNLQISFANSGAPTGLNTNNYNSYNYSTFGSNTSNNNAGTFQDNPSLTVMKTDIFGNGANPFEVFNAIDGWDSLNVNIVKHENCSITAITLFNATSTDLSVNITPSEGTVAKPGCSQVSCESGWSGAELRPYGYLTLFAGANAALQHLRDEVDVYSFGTLVGTVSVSGTGFCQLGTILDGSAASSPGSAFSFTPVQTQTPVSDTADGGVWTTIYQP